MRTLAAVLLPALGPLSLSAQMTESKPAPKEPTPTVFQADEGDRWMLLGTKPSFSRSIRSLPDRRRWW